MSKSDFFLNPILVKITCKIPRTESSKLHLLRNCCDARQLLFKMTTLQTIVWIKISWPLSFQSLKYFLIRDIFVKEDFTNQPQFLKSILNTWTHRLQKKETDPNGCWMYMSNRRKPCEIYEENQPFYSNWAEILHKL